MGGLISGRSFDDRNWVRNRDREFTTGRPKGAQKEARFGARIGKRSFVLGRCGMAVV